MNLCKHWELRGFDTEIVKIIQNRLGVSGIVAQLLVQRGVKSVDEARDFLYAGLEDLSDPFTIQGIAIAVARIQRAIDAKEKIVVYGDYDVDGVCSTVLLLECLQALGADPDYYVPDRFNEGYGLNTPAVEHLFKKGCSLLISVDCGITSVNEVETANRLGMDVIITDHHTPAAVLPPAAAIVNPKLEQNDRIKDLAGVGVAFKLAAALTKDRIAEEELCKWLDLVALATVADIVPLWGENRLLLRSGLSKLEQTGRQGLLALYEEAGLTGKGITPWHLGFVLGPRLNSAGRLDSARISIELLTTDDPVRAGELAALLENLNRERRIIEDGIFQEAVLYIENSFKLAKDEAIILADDNWHHGVIGIVASRLSSRYQRPVILICWEGNTGRGSARSIPGIDIYAALQSCQPYLLQFGGHKLAAGLSICREHFLDFKNELNSWIKANTAHDKPSPVYYIDAEIDVRDISPDLLKDIELLAPFGEGNPIPHFTIRSLGIKQALLIGRQQEHFKMLAEPGPFEGIAFNQPHFIDMPFTICYHDLLFQLAENDFRGRKSIQFRIRDMKCSFVPDSQNQNSMAGKLSAALGRAARELQNNRPVILVFPTCRSLKLMRTSLARSFRSSSLRELHGLMDKIQKQMVCQELHQGACRIFLLTRASLRYYLKAHNLPDNLQLVIDFWPGPDNLSSCLGSRNIEQLYGQDKPIAWEKAEWDYQHARKTVIYAHRRPTIIKLTRQVPGLIAATGVKDSGIRRDLRRQIRESEVAVVLADCSWRDIIGEAPIIDKLIFADAPFSLWEARYTLEQLAAASEYTAQTLFDVADFGAYRQYMARVYPDLQRLKKVLGFFQSLGCNQIKVELDELLQRLVQWAGLELQRADLWPILRIMEDLGLCSFEKKGSIIALTFHSRDKRIFDISDSLYYLEGLAEKAAFDSLEAAIIKDLVR